MDTIEEPASKPGIDELSVTKESLEIKKLQLEIKHIRRNFFAQLLNTAAIFGVGIAVLYFFQRPQIEQMEASRVESEKNQVATLVITVQGMPDAKVKRDMIKLLAKIFPNLDFLQAIQDSSDVATQPPDPTTDKKRICAELSAQSDGTTAALVRLQDKLKAEESGLRPGSVSGFGPVARSLQIQIESAVATLGAIQERKDKGC